MLFHTDGTAPSCQPTHCASSAVLRRRKAKESAIIPFNIINNSDNSLLTKSSKIVLDCHEQAQQKITEGEDSFCSVCDPVHSMLDEEVSSIKKSLHVNV